MVSILFRLVLAMVLGGILGMERGRKRRPAGFRTYMTVCVASALVAVGVALRHASFYTLYAFFYYLLVVACGEELVFRGYLFERLYAESSFCMAVLVSGLLYGLAHGIFSFAVLRASWWEIFSNIGGGIVGTAFYAFLFKQTGTIAVPVLVHWALDFCGYIF